MTVHVFIKIQWHAGQATLSDIMSVKKSHFSGQ